MHQERWRLLEGKLLEITNCNGHRYRSYNRHESIRRVDVVMRIGIFIKQISICLR